MTSLPGPLAAAPEVTFEEGEFSAALGDSGNSCLLSAQHASAAPLVPRRRRRPSPAHSQLHPV